MRGSLRRPSGAHRSRGPIPAHAGEPRTRAAWRRRGWPYPRACGGAATAHHIRQAATGLSPRMRGSLVELTRPELREGPIPAHAGEPSARARCAHSRRAYPRACGGAPTSRMHAQLLRGLSPRMRGSRRRSSARTRPSGAYPRACGGARHSTSDRDGYLGLSPRMRGSHAIERAAGPDAGPIPAHAGEPRAPPGGSGARWAYPRACGGAVQSDLSAAQLRGLSPRMRGSPHPGGIAAALLGPIPAHAGEPSDDAGRHVRDGAYPRACGGASNGHGFCPGAMGLSPRMRGSHCRLAACRSFNGPIPAHAGEPPRPFSPSAASRAYPRACGGAASPVRAGALIRGLSPRMRGSRKDRDEVAVDKGPIPAHAGEPASHPLSAGKVRAYPRACGGARRRRASAGRGTGLSPRMRGSPGPLPHDLQVAGPIPAHAGEPSGAPGGMVELGAYPRACGGAYVLNWVIQRNGGLSPRMRGSQGRERHANHHAGPIPAHAGEPRVGEHTDG